MHNDGQRGSDYNRRFTGIRTRIKMILWHIDPLLGGNREIGDFTAAVARQRPANNNRVIVFSVRSTKQQLNSNRGTMLSVLSMPTCYNQDNCSNELIVEQSPARKDLGTEAEDIFGIRHQETIAEGSRLRRFSTCCSELQSV
jgi:hypothetical protein